MRTAFRSDISLYTTADNKHTFLLLDLPAAIGQRSCTTQSAVMQRTLCNEVVNLHIDQLDSRNIRLQTRPGRRSDAVEELLRLKVLVCCRCVAQISALGCDHERTGRYCSTSAAFDL